MPERNRMLGEILVEMGCLAPDDLERAMREQPRRNERLGDVLLSMELVGAEDLTRALADQFDMEMIDLESADIEPSVINRIPADLAREQKIVPVDFDGELLTIAMGDPLDLYTLDNLRFVVNCQVECVLATKQAILDALNKYYGFQEEQIDELIQEFTQSNIEIINEETLAADEDGAEEAPVIRLVQLIMAEAVKVRASDIHIEPMADRLRIRYRVDGYCYEVESPPRRLTSAVIARIKIMSKGMNVAERRRPQDGRIKINMQGRDIDLRVSSLPATHGESVVMRILDRESVLFGLDQLGFHADDYRIFQTLIKRPNGIILVTGPTGSGKTTTLYAALNELNRSDRKIITAEDPVEYNISGINQCQVNRRGGMTFDKIIRAMLRQAPNIILVGEIRDGETANIAIQAALTGHLVFSTLHTNDAPASITRLIDMEVPPFLVASSIQAIVAQRLLRTICKNCREKFSPDTALLRSTGLTDAQMASNDFYRGKGCDTCRGGGYKGRLAIYEIMVMNTRLRDMAFNIATTDQLREQAIRDGMHTLMMDGMRKVLSGVTTVEEVLSVAKKVD